MPRKGKWKKLSKPIEETRTDLNEHKNSTRDQLLNSIFGTNAARDNLPELQPETKPDVSTLIPESIYNEEIVPEQVAELIVGKKHEKLKINMKIGASDKSLSKIKNNKLTVKSPKTGITVKPMAAYKPVARDTKYEIWQTTIGTMNDQIYDKLIIKQMKLPPNEPIVDCAKGSKRAFNANCVLKIKAGECPTECIHMDDWPNFCTLMIIDEEPFGRCTLERIDLHIDFYTYLMKGVKNRNSEYVYSEIACFHWIWRYNCKIDSRSGTPKVIGGVPHYEIIKDQTPPFPWDSLKTIRANENNCFAYFDRNSKLLFSFEFYGESERGDKIDQFYEDQTEMIFHMNNGQLFGFKLPINDRLKANLNRRITNERLMEKIPSLKHRTLGEFINDLIRGDFITLISQIETM